MKLSKAGEDLMHRFEGFRSKPYLCPAHIWTIGYGLVQAIAPSLVGRSTDGLSREVPAARLWAGLLTLVPLALALVVWKAWAPVDIWLVLGLGVFGFLFAVNSSVHSYLVLAYAGSEKAAEDVRGS